MTDHDPRDEVPATMTRPDRTMVDVYRESTLLRAKVNTAPITLLEAFAIIDRERAQGGRFTIVVIRSPRST